MGLITCALGGYLLYKYAKHGKACTVTETPRVQLSPDKLHPYSNLHVGSQWREIQGCDYWKSFSGDGKKIILNDVLKSEIGRIGDFSQACYDAFETKSGQCKYKMEEFFEKLGLDDRGYEITHYLHTAERDFFGKDNRERVEKKTWIGFVARCVSQAERDRLGRWDTVVALRGTKTPHEWMENVKCNLIPPKEGTKGGRGRISKGFGNVFEGFAETLVRAVEENLARYLHDDIDIHDVSVTFTGHSLGSALAILGAHKLATNIEKHFPGEPIVSGRPRTFTGRRVPITVFSFAGPRVGNKYFKEDMDQELGVPVLRVVSESDVVSKVPLDILSRLQMLGEWVGRVCYEHLGVVVKVRSCTSPYLKHEALALFSRAHSLPVMLHILDGYNNELGEFRPILRDYALVNRYDNFLQEYLGVVPKWGLYQDLIKLYTLRKRKEWESELRKHASRIIKGTFRPSSMRTENCNGPEEPREELIKFILDDDTKPAWACRARRVFKASLQTNFAGHGNLPLIHAVEADEINSEGLSQIVASNSSSQLNCYIPENLLRRQIYIERHVLGFSTFSKEATITQIVSRLHEISNYVDETLDTVWQSISGAVERDLDLLDEIPEIFSST